MTNCKTIKKGKCGMCGKMTSNLFADCVFNEWMCVDCYSKYDWYNKPNVANNVEKIERDLIYNKLFGA